MSVVDSCLNNVEGCALSSVHHFFLISQHKYLQIILPSAAPVKVSEKRYEIP